jgi:hypothetical protein
MHRDLALYRGFDRNLGIVRGLLLPGLQEGLMIQILRIVE